MSTRPSSVWMKSFGIIVEGRRRQTSRATGEPVARTHHTAGNDSIIGNACAGDRPQSRATTDGARRAPRRAVRSAEPGLDPRRHCAHVGAAGELGLQHAHHLAHARRARRRRCGDRRIDRRVDLGVGQLLRQVRLRGRRSRRARRRRGPARLPASNWVIESRRCLIILSMTASDVGVGELAAARPPRAA